MKTEEQKLCEFLDSLVAAGISPDMVLLTAIRLGVNWEP